MMEDNNIKCGEVFLTFEGAVIFHCELCAMKYNKIQSYGLHIIDKHIIDFVDIFETLDSQIENMYLPEIPEYVKEKYANLEDLNESDIDKIESPLDPFNQAESVLLNDVDSYDKLCGEVHLTKTGILIFSCTICSCKYKGVKEFTQHVVEVHYEPQEVREVSIEILCPENSENEKSPLKCNNKIIIIKGNVNKIDENIKKPLPMWKEKFDSIYCAESNSVTYKCKLCSTVIKDKTNIVHHIKRVHEKVKRFECTECYRRFHTRSEHKIHMRLHTGEKPYLCNECGKSFISASELHKHKIRYHTQRIRDKACTICGKTFITRKNLLKHKTVHSEERPFKCKVCDAGFKVKSSLILHNRIHEDKRMFKCNLCSASYNYKSILKSHMQSKHSIALE